MFLVDHQVAAVLAAAALSVLSSAERPVSPFFKAPAIDTASSLLSGSSINPAPSVKSFPAIFSGASLRYVAGVGEVSPVNTCPAPAVVSKVEFDCVMFHGPIPWQRNVIGYSLLVMVCSLVIGCSLFVNRDQICPKTDLETD
jgi:hypothetical protein